MSLLRDRFWDNPVANTNSPTRQPMCPGRPASVMLGTKCLAQPPQWHFGARMCLSHIPSGCRENTQYLPRAIRLGLRPFMADSEWWLPSICLLTVRRVDSNLSRGSADRCFNLFINGTALPASGKNVSNLSISFSAPRSHSQNHIKINIINRI